MHYALWGIDRSPFAGRQTPSFYEGESQAEAMARLRFAVAEGRSAMVLGSRGMGKSLVLSEFAPACRRAGRDVVALSLAGLSPREFLWRVAGQLTLAPRPEEDGMQLYCRIADYAASSPWRNSSAVLLLDDAQLAGPDVQAALGRILTCSEQSAWLSMALAASQDQTSRLSPSLLDAIDLRIDLGPWSEAETIGYVQHALLDAGCERPIFEDEAIAVLYVLSEGVPRWVNRLADQSLLGAAAQGLDMIDAGIVEAAQDAISWTLTA